jgi:hypothetical protein
VGCVRASLRRAQLARERSARPDDDLRPCVPLLLCLLKSDCWWLRALCTVLYCTGTSVWYGMVWYCRLQDHAGRGRPVLVDGPTLSQRLCDLGHTCLLGATHARRRHTGGTQAHARTRAHRHRRSQAHRHTGTQAHRHTRVHTGARTHAHTDAHRHTDTQAHRHTRVHTGARTHAGAQAARRSAGASSVLSGCLSI